MTWGFGSPQSVSVVAARPKTDAQRLRWSKQEDNEHETLKLRNFDNRPKCVRVCIYVCAYMCICICKCMCVSVYMCMCVICECMYICMCDICVCVYMCIYM